MRYLGRKAELTAGAALDRRAAARAARPGRQAGQRGARRRSRRCSSARTPSSRRPSSTQRLAEDRVDVTLPGDPPVPVGHLHLVTQTRREMEDIFVGLGFSVVEGPEVEYDYYNFTALNHPPEHPARLLQDTFYLAEQVLLRTHTSPMQVRAMELQEPPIYIVVPGRVYRPRHADATHTPMFHQLEGLAIDEDITLADLQGTLLAFARAMFGERHARCGCGPATSRSPSRASRSTCPASAAAAPAAADGSSAARPARARAGSRSSARGWSTRTCSATWRQRLRPGARAGLRVRDGHRAHRDARAPGARPAHAVRERPAPAGAVRSRAMRVPFAWLRSYCDPGTARRGDGRRAHDGRRQARAAAPRRAWATRPRS